MTRFLLDTNTVSALVKDPTGPAAQRAMAADGDDLFTNVVIASEIAYGFHRRPGRRTDLLQAQWVALCEVVPVASLDEDVVGHSAAIRVALEAAGTPIGSNDLLIAAHALSLGAVVVTDNVLEFSRVPGLRVENWLRPSDPPGEGP